jgi:hypothetical protein
MDGIQDYEKHPSDVDFELSQQSELEFPEASGLSQ